MEIKKIDNEIINKYPKMNEFNKKGLKKYVPSKWAKINLLSLIFATLIKGSSANALSNIEFPNDLQLAGVVAINNPVYETSKKGTPIFIVLSICFLLLSIILTAIKKHKTKKELTTKITSKKLKILYIITVISIIMSITLIILSNTVSPWL